MEGRILDLTIVSAEDLKKVGLIGKMHTYAVAWVDPYLRQHTAVDRDGGCNPSWNQKLSFPVPEHFFQQPHSNLVVEIFSKSSISDDKLVGSSVIPLSEITQKSNQDGVSTHQVKRKSGRKVKGSLKLVTHVGEKTTISGAAAAAAAAPPAQAMAYDQNRQYEQAPPYGYPAGGAAMAVPYGYPQQGQYPAGNGYGGYGGGQGYYQQPGPPQQYYPAQPQRRPGMGGMGMGLGTGLLAGAVGGLLVGDIIDDAFDGGCDGGF